MNSSIDRQLLIGLGLVTALFLLLLWGLLQDPGQFPITI
jgi:hypothetical protein